MTLDLSLYVVTDVKVSRGLGHVESARRALKGGADVIQLRDKHLPSRELYDLAVEMTQLAHGYGALLIVNDRLDIAIASGADGAHLGQDDVPVKEARKLAPQNFIIGASVGNIDEALAAERDGADYVALSPIFSTPSKSDAGPGHGLGVLADIRRSVRVPVIAIGGITPANAASVIKAGADGVAVISAVIGQTDVERAARELKNIVLAAKAGKKRI